MAETDVKLAFVYNADSGLFNNLSDIAHKIFSPETYACSLCAITYGTFGIREEWQRYLETLKLPLEFLHRDDLGRRFPGFHQDLPVILLVRGEEPEVLVTADEIAGCRNIDDLKTLLDSSISRTGSDHF